MAQINPQPRGGANAPGNRLKIELVVCALLRRAARERLPHGDVCANEARRSGPPPPAAGGKGQRRATPQGMKGQPAIKFRANSRGVTWGCGTLNSTVCVCFAVVFFFNRKKKISSLFKTNYYNLHIFLAFIFKQPGTEPSFSICLISHSVW